MHVGDILSTAEDTQYRGGIMISVEGYTNECYTMQFCLQLMSGKEIHFMLQKTCYMLQSLAAISGTISKAP